MREYKFRAWNVFEKEMDYEVTIDPNGKVAAFSPLDGQYVRGFSNSEMILMQYTELHDDTEDDNELFEGDIVAITWADEKHICKIEFSAGTFMFVADSLPDGYLPLHELAEYDRRYGWVKGAEKLGNIYTSPELLGG